MTQNHILQTTITISLFLIGILTAEAQTQLPNSNFEQWTVTTPGKAVPTGWHTFSDGDCRLSGLASIGCSTGKKNHSSRVAGHHGYACEITASSILGIVANGAMTTGQMVLASTTPRDTINIIYSDIHNKVGHNGYAKFTGRPDSVYMWCKVSVKKSTSIPSCKIHLHGAVPYVDVPKHTAGVPQDGKIANAFCTFTGHNDGQWHQYRFPFVYYDSNGKVTTSRSRQPSYALASFSTNKVPGSGNSGDKLAFDDIVMIYNKRLSQILIDGEPLDGFHPDITQYELVANDTHIPYVTAEAASPNATVSVEQASAANHFTVTITVTHDDGQKIYTLPVTFLFENRMVAIPTTR